MGIFDSVIPSNSSQEAIGSTNLANTDEIVMIFGGKRLILKTMDIQPLQ